MCSGGGGDTQHQQNNHFDGTDHDQSPSRSSTQSSCETKFDEKEYAGDEYGNPEAQWTKKDVNSDRAEVLIFPVQQRPRTPPPVVTRFGGERFMSIDSTCTGNSVPLSPTETLSDGREKPSTLLFGDLDRFCTSPNKSQNNRPVQRKDSSNVAAPAHFVAKPRKEALATTMPSIRTRYDRPIVMYDSPSTRQKIVTDSNQVHVP